MKLQARARARPARYRIAPDRRDRAQAVCRLNSPPIPHLNANHSRHTTASNLAIHPGAAKRGNAWLCRSAIASPTGIGRLNRPH